MSLSPKDLDFVESKNAAAREIALAMGVPPMLLGIPGDNTYTNFQEANCALWRQTVLALVTRTARALAAWLAPDEDLELRPDLDAIEALAPEREALWSRLEAASFLSTSEKRAAAGYGEGAGGAAVEPGPEITPKFNPHHDALGRFTFGPGVGRIEQIGDPLIPGVSLKEEDALGGHAIRRHVAKTDEYLLALFRNSRYRGPFITIARISEGSFVSLESANDLVNRTLESRPDLVELVSRGVLPEKVIDRRSGYITGREALRSSADSDPYIRPTYSVRVVIIHDKRRPRGYMVKTAFPINEAPKQ